MTKEKAKKIFDRYNNPLDVVRCPRGRSPVRKELDTYARAAVNLYGIISRDELVSIFNRQNEDQTNKEEVYVLLLPLVLKEGFYGFYKDYLVHYYFLNDFDQAEYLLSHQENKPRYIPPKNEFIKYVSEYYRDSNHLQNLRHFMFEAFGYSGATVKGINEISDYLFYDEGINGLGPILDRNNLIFNSEEELQRFLNLVMDAKNNLRLWENKGHSPSELFEMQKEERKNVIEFPKVIKKKIGRNDKCPCGSGKKYKKCCSLFDNAETAQLSSIERQEFYKIWYGLMSFVNDRKGIIKSQINAEYPERISEMSIFKVREALWNEPELIDKYINEAELAPDEIDILKKWKSNHKKGTFLIMKYLQEYAVAIAPNEEGEDRLYGIKGISSSVATTLLTELPIMVETVLIPFKSKIIYDSFMNAIEVGYGEDARSHLQHIYDKAIEFGIITSLN